MSEGGRNSHIRVERTYDATPDEVWKMWTTKQGIESWWGPDGFATRVTTLEVRPGGRWEYSMAAVDPQMIEAVKSMDMPVSQTVRSTIVEVEPGKRLVYKTVTDFIPGVAPYEIRTVVEFDKVGKRVRMVVTEDAMHDARWTELSTMGLNQQFDKLGKALARR